MFNVTPEISVGNIVTIIGGLIATVMMWQKLNDKVDTNSKAVDKNTKDLEELSKQALNINVQQHERRITDLENSMAVMSEAIVTIKNDIAWMRQMWEYGGNGNKGMKHET